MRFVLVSVVALALVGVARPAPRQVVTLAPTEDLSLPFLCDWGYAWEERCYWDDSDRVGVGGVGDKVWRAGLRFSLDAVPANAEVVSASLALWYDGTCVAPRRTTRSCEGRGFQFDAHPIYTVRWRAEREVAFGPVLGGASLEAQAPARWLTWDVTQLVADWQSGALANAGILLKLIDAQERFDSGGPAFPSSSYVDPAVRPRLTVSYRLGGTL